jgi:hypothetical protein
MILFVSFEDLTLKRLLFFFAMLKRYYTQSLIGAVRGRVAPNDDKEILDMRNKCLAEVLSGQ